MANETFISEDVAKEATPSVEETVKTQPKEDDDIVVSADDLVDGDLVATDIVLETGEVLSEGTIREINGKKYLETTDGAGSTFLTPIS